MINNGRLSTVQRQALKKIEGIQATAGKIDGAINSQIGFPKTYQSGKYIMSQLHQNSNINGTNTATQVTFVPIWVDYGISVNGLAVKVSGTAANGGKFVLGLYDSSADGGIGVLLQQTAEQTMDATTYKLYEAQIVTTALPAGKYWMAIHRNEAVATMYGANASISPLIWSEINYTAAQLYTAKTNFPAYTYAYTGTLPTDLSAVNLVNGTNMGAVANAISPALKLA